MERFIKEHAEDDLNRLLLSAARYPDIDVPYAVRQIACRRQIRHKLPSWYANDSLTFPSGLAAEQCSSEQTAVYKQGLADGATHICDLTGGLGVDSFFLARRAARLTYMERQENYCRAARRNFASLGATNIDVLQGDARLLLAGLPPTVDLFYIDPARRGGGGKRIFALRDCEPDLTDLLPALLERAPRVIAKLSPMADLRQSLALLPGTRQAHVLSVRNECKELLFVIERQTLAAPPAALHCIHFTAEGKEESFSFDFREEENASAPLAKAVNAWLYEPNSSILKAGAFRSVARLGVQKLHVNSHLYTSGRLLEDFPGRRFAVDRVLPFNNKLRRNLRASIPRAHIAVRNFPLTADELRRSARIADGGEIYLFATTLYDNTRALIVCRKHNKQ
jgi:hypothetical protein